VTRGFGGAGFPRPRIEARIAVVSLFWKREREARKLIGDYFQACDTVMAAFEEATRCYLERGDCEAFAALDERVRTCESAADTLRNDVEKVLYKRALLPESRGDILALLEAFDHIPNLAETVTFMLYTQRIAVPATYAGRIGQLLDVNLEAYRLVRRVVDLLLTTPDRVGDAMAPVKARESESDRLERSIIHDAFRSELDKADMMLLRELVSRIGDISDRAEEVSRRIDILSLKRRI